VRGFWPRDAFDRAVTELLGPIAQSLLGGVREKRRNHRSADRQHAEWKSNRRAAQPRLPRALPVLAAHPDEAAHRHGLEFLASVAPRLKQRLADREQADDENEHVDAVE